MKLYTKKLGEVLDGNDKLIDRIYRQLSTNNKLTFEGEDLLTEEEWIKYKKSQLKYKKLKIDYSKIKQINLNFTYFAGYNGTGCEIVVINNDNSEIDCDNNILDENDFFLDELIKDSEGGDCLYFKEHISPFFDIEQVRKYNIKFYSVKSKEFINIDILDDYLFDINYNDYDN